MISERSLSELRELTLQVSLNKEKMNNIKKGDFYGWM